MLILIIIYIQSWNNPDKEFLQDRFFISMIKLTFALLAIDILSRFDGRPDTIYYYINHFANFAMFVLSPILPAIWVLYVHYQIHNDEKRTRKLIYPFLLIIILNAIMVILTQYNSWYYYIDADNIYHRGDLYWIGPAITIALLALAYIMIVINRKKIEKKYYFSLAFFALPPLVAIIIQITFYGTSIILNSVVLSIMVVLLNIQNRSIYIDYLTGLNNRKKIELYLKNKVNLSTKGNTFSAIMLDLNDFKLINDIHGHDIGDCALKASADLLKSCIRSNDFIGRFGGDEFIIILNTSNRRELEEITDRIIRSFEDYNNSGLKAYKLSASIGYDIYNLEMTLEEFEKHIDNLMYENKQMIKGLA